MNIKAGKTTKRWLKTRKEWLAGNPPDHAGYYLCGICLRPVHYTDFELDHVNGRKGENLSSWDNLQPTHRECNQRKGSKRGYQNVSKREYEFRKSLDL